MDTISIDKLKIYCNHGVFRDEQINGQNFYVSARLGVDTYQAGITDDLDKSVNYAELSHVITDYMQNNRYNLIEAVANILRHIFLNIQSLYASLHLLYTNLRHLSDFRLRMYRLQ